MISLRLKQQEQKNKMISSDAQKQNRCKEKKETTQTQSKRALVLTRSWPASLSSRCCVLLASQWKRPSFHWGSFAHPVSSEFLLAFLQAEKVHQKKLRTFDP